MATDISRRNSAQAKLWADLRRQAAAQGVMLSRDIAEKAGVSIPTLRKHAAAGYVPLAHIKVGSRRLLAAETPAAMQYILEAQSLVSIRDMENRNRGPIQAPHGYRRLDEVAAEARLTTGAIAGHIAAGTLATVKYPPAMLVKDDEARRFVSKYGLTPPPPGMASIKEAARLSGLNAATVRYAANAGHIAAIPAEHIFTDGENSRIGRPKILVSIADAKAYAQHSRSEKLRMNHLQKMASEITGIKND